MRFIALPLFGLLVASYFSFASSAALQLSQNYQNGTCYEAVDGYSAPIDFFPDKVSVVYSELWDIEYKGSYKILTFKGASSGGTEYAPEKYLLFQCGTEIPEDETISSFAAVLAVPVKSVSVDATSEIPYLELLGLRDRIAAVFIDELYISSPCVHALIAQDRVTYAPIGDATGWATPVVDDVEMNLVSWGNPEGLAGPVKFFDYLEQKSVLARAGWLKYMSVFFNAEGSANSSFDTIVERYTCVGDTAENHAQKNEEVLKIPRTIMAWGYYTDYVDWEDQHHIGWSVAQCNGKARDGSEGPYYCEFARAAGVHLLNVTDDEKGSVVVGAYRYMTDDEFIVYAKSADILIYPSAWPEFTTVLAEKPGLSAIIAVSTKRVYDNQGMGLNDWYESTNAQPAAMLEDFAYVADDQSGVFYKDKLTWLRNVFKGQIGKRGTCTGIKKPLQIQKKFECLDYDQVWSLNAPAAVKGALNAVAVAVAAVAFFTLL